MHKAKARADFAFHQDV